MSNGKTAKEIISSYDRQIRKDIGFWIKYRPSLWVELLSEKPLRPLIKFIKTKAGKKFVLIAAVFFSLLFLGVIPTLNLIWSNIFRLWLIIILVPLSYWSLAIASVYGRVVFKAFYGLIKVVFYKLIDH